MKGLFVTVGLAALCRYSEYRILFIVFLKVAKLSVIVSNLVVTLFVASVKHFDKL
jgi:hypothetical protein